MRVRNPGMTKAEKVDEITSWVMNDEGLYNAHLRAKTSVMRQREVADWAAEMAGIRDQAAIGRAAKELVQTFKETNPYVGDAVQSASARKKQEREKERQQKYGYPAPPRRNAEGHSRGDATLAAGLGSLGGSLIGGIGGAIVGVPMLGAEVGSVAGAIAGGHYYAPPRSMRRTMTGAGIGGLFGPIGAAIGGYVGAGKPDGGGKKSNPHRKGHRKSRNPAVDENPARVRRMMNPKNY